MKLSIITVNKNNALGLERTCQSIVCQTFNDFEWLVIDGASNDSSVDIIKKYAKRMIYWVSEPDTGIYNAMNKGIKQAKGDYCLFLNSGDWLFGIDSLLKAFDIINSLDEADVYYGDSLRSDNSIWKMPENLSIDSLYLQAAPSHQNTFIKRSLFSSHGFYDENYRTISDSIFWIKEYWLHHSKFIYINTIISVYSIGGVSLTYKPARRELNEAIMNIMGRADYDILVKRNTNMPYIFIYLKKILKNLLPYGFIQFYDIYKKNKNR
ncbi:MAG: glycosyltransferase [Treponema sp.]|jgi:glycosyltransferase involved in cell wall biosynthesis|nr:glycosyltransferase [Treponema sp.]